MNEDKKCPKCGATIADEWKHELCPACLMKAGMESVGTPSPQANDATRTGGGPFVPLPGTPPAIDEVRKLFPQLEILEQIGRGGMGIVYKARQPRLDRVVALKILSVGPGSSGAYSGFAERFSREARALAKLNHPNIVSVFDFGQAGGHFYFIMEFVDGANLRQMIAEKQITPETALTIVPKVCEALQFAHDEGILHRDIKPENILIDRKGRVKIADFGLAKLIGDDTVDHSLTGTQQIMGTPRYMAPEQFENTKTVDHRADIYSLGVVFYEMLTGEIPMGRFALPSQKVQVDVRIDEVVLRSLEREPAQRYQHVSEVKTGVENVTLHGGHGVMASPPSPPKRDGETPSLQTAPQAASAPVTLGKVMPLVAPAFGMLIALYSVRHSGVAFVSVLFGSVVALAAIWFALFRRRDQADDSNSGGAGTGAVELVRPPVAPELREKIRSAGILMLIAGIAIATSGLFAFIYGTVTSIRYAATVTNPDDHVATRAAGGAFAMLALMTLCGIAILVGGVSMRKLRYHGYTLGISILLMALLPVTTVLIGGRMHQVEWIFFQLAFGLYAGIKCFRLLRKSEVEAAFESAAEVPTSGKAGGANFQFLENQPPKKFLGLRIWAWVLIAIPLALAAVFVPGPGELPGPVGLWVPKDAANIFQPVLLVTPANGSYRVVSVQEGQKLSPVFALTLVTSSDQKVTREFGADRQRGVNLGFFHRSATWKYRLTATRFDDWKGLADGPVEIDRKEISKLLPLVVEELDQRGFGRGKRLNDLLDIGHQEATVACWQNVVVLAAWCVGSMAILAIASLLFTTRAGRITLCVVAGLTVLAIPFFTVRIPNQRVENPVMNRAHLEKALRDMGVSFSPDDSMETLRKKVADITENIGSATEQIEAPVEQQSEASAKPKSSFVVGKNGPELSREAVSYLKLSALQAGEVNKILQRTAAEATALERRHTKVGKDEHDLTVVTIEPYSGECQELARKMVAELGGLVDASLLPKIEVGLLPREIFGLAGECRQTITLWKVGDGKVGTNYRVKEEHTEWVPSPGMVRSASSLFHSGANLESIPEKYRVYWRQD